MEDKITQEKLEKYFSVTRKALEIARENIFDGKHEESKEIIEMVENYLSDARHFMDKEDFVNAFGALNYSHGWIDCGARLGIFDVEDRDLFTVAD